MDDRDQRIEELETQIQALAIRHSALEWIVEQHFAHYLLMQMEAGDARDFLNGVSHAGVPSWQRTEEGEQRPRPDREQQLRGDIRHICAKVETRVSQGLRRRG